MGDITSGTFGTLVMNYLIRLYQFKQFSQLRSFYIYEEKVHIQFMISK